VMPTKWRPLSILVVLSITVVGCARSGPHLTGDGPDLSDGTVLAARRVDAHLRGNLSPTHDVGVLRRRRLVLE